MSMEVYMINEEDLTRIQNSDLDKEQHLEEYLSKSRGAEIGGVEIMYIGRQESPSKSGIFDLLGVDETGNTVVLELKRDRPTREIVSQALEYASGVRTEEYEELNDWFQQYLYRYTSQDIETETGNLTLAEAHQDFFGREDPLDPSQFNTEQRLLLVGADFNKRTLNIVDFLREHDMDVICVEYRTYKTEDTDLKLLTTDSVRRPLSVEPTGNERSELTEYRRRQLEFWQGFVEEVQSRDTRVDPREPEPNNVLVNHVGRSGCRLAFFVLLNDNMIRCQLIVERDDKLFEDLRDDKQSIESKFDQMELQWEPAGPDGVRNKIKIERSVDVDDQSTWPECYDWLIDVGDRMNEVFVPRIRSQ